MLAVARDYASAISGSLGRLVFSLAYFVALANTLPIEDFGLFATASATGVVLSRLLAFGFVSPLYRAATVRPRLVGTYMAGFVALGALSLPLIAVCGAIAYKLFFDGLMDWRLFALVIATEAVIWRGTEAVIITLNGCNRFGRAAILTVFGTMLRAAGAVGLAFAPQGDLALWCWIYLAANTTSLAVASAFFYPGGRLRLAPRLYGRRMRDSIAVAGADVMFYVQMELDKILVLSLAGPRLAGIYAIIMRLVDLTAVPVRAFSMLLVQKLMRAPALLARLRTRIAIEAGIFVVSTAALAFLVLILWFRPTLLGNQVAEVAPLVGLALLVPGLRNLVEYEAELLYARGQTLLRALNFALLGGMKAVLLSYVLTRLSETPDVIWWLNPVFLVIYAASVLLTYSAMRLPARVL
ncbi:MAG: lipopolysaccharide biosynthesis protein [Rhizobiaceae bacterium]|nr:lipopolysaccharide biosynthesis protein [Rhizobiaceae bacterium]MCV0406075.1 lipopolysaccharide biosynthesis protein [Rhizobiaceae bacterium]